MISVRFDDVAVFFTEDEWRSLEEWQKELYKDVMKENYQSLVYVDRSDRAFGEEELDMELQIDCPEELLEDLDNQPQWDMLDILIFLDELFDL